MLLPKNAVGWALIAAIATPVATVQSQGVRPQDVPRRVLPELRAEFATGDVTTGHIAAGFHVNSGTYVRIALLAGAGRAWMDDEEGESYRFELQGRFHLDPFRSARFGVYGIGGVTVGYDPFADWQSRLVAGAGVELAAHGHATWAIETAFAGGFRVSLVTRRLTLGRR